MKTFQKFISEDSKIISIRKASQEQEINRLKETLDLTKLSFGRMTDEIKDKLDRRDFDHGEVTYIIDSLRKITDIINNYYR